MKVQLLQICSPARPVSGTCAAQQTTNLAAPLIQPIFEGGRLKSNVRLTEAQRDQMVLTYRQTIQGAFRDVSNALVAYRKDQDFTAQQQHLFDSARDTAR
jgi:outer membrane protein, multidrug efflux system